MARITTTNIYKGISFPFRKGSSQYPEQATDATLIKESLSQLIQTSKRERVMRPEFGSNAWGYLFEENDEVLAALIRTDIGAVVSKYEPRIRLIDVLSTRKDSTVWVSLLYYIPALQREDNLMMSLT
jgi:phage baseplate assembly protein W